MINPIGFLITILYFKLAQKIKKTGIIGDIPPIVVAGLAIIFTLEVFQIDFDTYNQSASYITLFLIPATIALGYPIYKHFDLLKKYKRVIYSAFFIATIIAMLATYLLAKLCHSELSIIESMLPKSVTAPIAVEISKKLGGIPELTACIVVMTGVFGAMFGHKILKWINVKSDVAIGLSIGVASHVVGTSKCVETHREKQIVMASVALVIVGLLTALIAPLFIWFLGYFN